MSAPIGCVTNCCPEAQDINVPGPTGETGAAGKNGADGVSSFTVSTADATFNDSVASVAVAVANNTMFAVGQTLFGADPAGGTDHGTFEVIALTGSTSV